MFILVLITARSLLLYVLGGISLHLSIHSDLLTMEITTDTEALIVDLEILSFEVAWH